MDVKKKIEELKGASHQSFQELRSAPDSQLKEDRGAILKMLSEFNGDSSDEDERRAVKFLEDELASINGELRHREPMRHPPQGTVFGGGDLSDRSGRHDYDVGAVLTPSDSVRSYMRDNRLIRQPEFEELRFGQLIRAMVTGPRTDLERRALSEGTDSAGGFGVPDIVLGRFIDLMRAATVTVRAGAQTVPLTSDKTTIARTASDPAAAWRVENAAVAVADSTYEAVVFEPKSLAVIVKVSRELLEDSLNIEQMLEASFAGSMAVELDRVALVGSGIAPEPQGIYGTTNVGSVTSVGTPADYAKFIDGLYELWLDNEPTCSAIVMHPRTLATLSKMVTGITSDKTPLVKPAVLQDIPIMQTTSIPITLGGGGNESLAIMGNFARLMIGVRTALRVEVLRELYAGNYQYGFIAHLRADIAVEHPESFAVLSGVTA